MKIAVFVSGRGSNLKAILNYPDLKNLMEIVAVLSDKSDCKAFEIAKEYGIKSFSVGDGAEKIKQMEITTHLKKLEVGLVVLAGYLKTYTIRFDRKF